MPFAQSLQLSSTKNEESRTLKDVYLLSKIVIKQVPMKPVHRVCDKYRRIICYALVCHR